MNFFMEFLPKLHTELALSMFCLTQNKTRSPSPRNGDLEVPHYVVSQWFMKRELKEHINYLYSRHFYPLKLFTKDTHMYIKFYKFSTFNLEFCLKKMMLYWFFFITFHLNLIGSWAGIFGTVFLIIILGQKGRKILHFLFKNDGKEGN